MVNLDGFETKKSPKAIWLRDYYSNHLTVGIRAKVLKEDTQGSQRTYYGVGLNGTETHGIGVGAFRFQYGMMLWMLYSTMDKLTIKSDVFEAMVRALKEETMAMKKALSTRIEELEEELVVCRATIGRGVLGVTLNCEIDVP
ncbi:hypothetical protein J1N35_004578 [Gossypium stocksii]|uniref:Uncharacterized protein n=1 Tax=Gossypium stocksii TaxID=47602 RepID=A0A9D3WDW6_9ROSI|nr:hypothetical protein J1N35_004578 [Gossypium stocksii]